MAIYSVMAERRVIERATVLIEAATADPVHELRDISPTAPETPPRAPQHLGKSSPQNHFWSSLNTMVGSGSPIADGTRNHFR